MYIYSVYIYRLVGMGGTTLFTALGLGCLWGQLRDEMWSRLFWAGWATWWDSGHLFHFNPITVNPTSVLSTSLTWMFEADDIRICDSHGFSCWYSAECRGARRTKLTVPTYIACVFIWTAMLINIGRRLFLLLTWKFWEAKTRNPVWSAGKIRGIKISSRSL